MSSPTFKDLLSRSFQQDLKSLTKPKPEPSCKPAAQQVRQSTQTASQENGEKNLFMQAMQGVTPLKTDAKVVHKVKKTDDNAAFRRAAAQGGEGFETGSLSDMQALLNPVAGEAYLSYKNPTLQNKVFEQLKQGKLRWYDGVDLHGSSIEESRSAICLLIHNALENGENVVKIVHGKGKDAIIKTCVNGWLRQMPQVMAFVSAPANDGGNGAVLVLLKKKKDT